jgi:hypothetical protein
MRSTLSGSVMNASTRMRPMHPDHGKVRSEAHGAPSFRPALCGAGESAVTLYRFAERRTP